jgi:hypothetical protein
MCQIQLLVPIQQIEEWSRRAEEGGLLDRVDTHQEEAK